MEVVTGLTMYALQEQGGVIVFFPSDEMTCSLPPTTMQYHYMVYADTVLLKQWELQMEDGMMIPSLWQQIMRG